MVIYQVQWLKKYIKYKHFSSTQEEIAEELTNGDVLGVINVNILAVGTDIPCLEVCVTLRATTSVALYLQMLGRCSRLYEGKTEFIHLDFGDNERRLGTYIEDREWSIWHEQSTSSSPPNLKICGDSGQDKKGNVGCSRLILSSISICPRCGYRFRSEKELRQIELVERLKDEPTSFSDMSPQALVDYAELKKYKKTWCFRQLFNRAKSPKQFRDDMRSLGYSNKYIYGLQMRYK